MSRIKTDARQNERAPLNTTIRKEVLMQFKSDCKELGMPMNMIIEIFMTQFSNGEFQLKMAKNNRLEIDE